MSKKLKRLLLMGKSLKNVSHAIRRSAISTDTKCTDKPRCVLSPTSLIEPNRNSLKRLICPSAFSLISSYVDVSDFLSGLFYFTLSSGCRIYLGQSVLLCPLRHSSVFFFLLVITICHPLREKQNKLTPGPAEISKEIILYCDVFL